MASPRRQTVPARAYSVITPQEPPSPSSLRARLAEIDREIAALHTRLTDLAIARTPVVDALKSVVYPILTIPLEITAVIFAHYVDVASAGAHDRRRSVGQPTVLASVCRAWRNIALNLPDIWSRIRIYTYQGSKVTNMEKLLRCWLQRAGVQPLDLDLDGVYSPTAPMFSIIVPLSSQWRNIVFCTLDTEVLALLPNLCGRVPALQKLALRVGRYTAPPPIPITALLDAPQLRELRLSYVTPHWFSLPWVQLTTLSLIGQHSSHYIIILQQTPNLEVLSLDNIRFTVSSFPCIRLERLHTLKIEQDDAGDLRFLEVLTVPALKSLIVKMDPEILDDERDDPPSHLHSLVQRSKCSPTSVVLMDVDAGLAIEILSATPTATDIVIERLKLEKQGGSFFEWIADHPGFIPKLQKLRVECEELEYGMPYGEIARMLDVRAHAGVAATNDSTTSPTALQQLEFTSDVNHELSTQVEALRAVEKKIRAHRPNCNIQIKGPRSVRIEASASIFWTFI